MFIEIQKSFGYIGQYDSRKTDLNTLYRSCWIQFQHIDLTEIYSLRERKFSKC